VRPVPAVIVEKGDTLSAIAEAKLGRARAWPLLAAVNRIADPRKIQPGDLIVLPYGVEP
jgi:nucleoid-associated protein YgaU